MKPPFAIILIAMLATACAERPREAGRADQRMDAFIDSLLGQMTLKEKIGLLNRVSVSFHVSGSVFSEYVEEMIRQGLVVRVFNSYSPGAVRKFQEMAVNATRLKIPLLFGFGLIHGHRTLSP